MKRKIFSVLGVMPEPGGYAAAKFSRTPVYKSYQDWVMELTEEGAEKFYNSFYFQYGHGSIADLAHLMVIFENISVPARNILLDDQLIDAQSRSTRYVDYSKGELIVPSEIKKDKDLLSLFRETTKEMIDLYYHLTEKVAELYLKQYAKDKPKEMDEDTFKRTVKARAIDVGRYLLPCAIPKSMGIIGSGRTWERIITKFLSSDLLECQEIGKELQAAVCKKQAFNPSLLKIESADFLSGDQKEKIKKLVSGNNVGLPTLVKYAQRNEYQKKVHQKILKLSKKLDLKSEPDSRRGVELYENINPEIDLAATLFYKVLPYSYGQIVKAVKKDVATEAIKAMYEERGQYDTVLKEAATGGLTFDICMDIGGFRDLHRHRNAVQMLKEVSPVYGFDEPKEVKEVGLEKEYQAVVARSEKVYWKLERRYKGVGQYVLPQATKRRFLMRMTPWELQYIVELRTRPQGHPSYREICYQMYQLFLRKYPQRAKYFRAIDPKIIDFFKR